MKISTKGRYGLRILFDLAIHDDGAPRLIRDIAASQQISEKYLSRLIIALRKAGMVRSIRGAHGGFRLKKSPETISLLDVVEAMEGPVAIVDCVGASGQCGRRDCCPTRSIWDGLTAAIREEMRRITLQNIIDNHKKLSAENCVLDYCI